MFRPSYVRGSAIRNTHLFKFDEKNRASFVDSYKKSPARDIFVGWLDQ